MTIIRLFLALSFLTVPAWAEKAPSSESDLLKDASDVVVGTVSNITSATVKSRYNKGWGAKDTDYTFTLTVEKVDKGTAFKPGATATVKTWKVKRHGLGIPMPGPSGFYADMPVKGKRYRFFVNARSKGEGVIEYWIITPNGVVGL